MVDALGLGEVRVADGEGDAEPPPVGLGAAEERLGDSTGEGDALPVHAASAAATEVRPSPISTSRRVGSVIPSAGGEVREPLEQAVNVLVVGVRRETDA